MWWRGTRWLIIRKHFLFCCWHSVSDDGSMPPLVIQASPGPQSAFSFSWVTMRSYRIRAGIVCLCGVCLSWVWLDSARWLISSTTSTLINNPAGWWRWSTSHLNTFSLCVRACSRWSIMPVWIYVSAKNVCVRLFQWVAMEAAVHQVCECLFTQQSVPEPRKQSTFVGLDDKLTTRTPQWQVLWCTRAPLALQ